MMVDHEFETLPEKYREVIPKSDHVLFTEPTAACSSGTKGRVAVMEAIEMNTEIQNLILKSASEDEISEVARRNGFISMKEDAIIKALQHVIPFEEVGTLGGDLLLSDEAEKEANALKSPTAGDLSDESTQSEEPEVSQAVDNPPPLIV